MSMLWQGQELGLKFENQGTIGQPEIKASIFHQKDLPKNYLENLIPEIRWRFNLDTDISPFCEKFKKDKVLGPIISKWKGMKPRAANSLYEILIIYIVLQNATVKRSVQMLENLFNKFGKKVAYDGKILAAFWEPQKIAAASEQELRDLKVGYRAKYIKKISEQFANKEIDEFALRKMGREEVKRKMLKLYGIGPASVEYLLFEDFYFCDTLETIPPWEQKIMSKLIFDKDLVVKEEILGFFKKYEGWEKLAFIYIWEDVFWRRKHEHIEWLEKEIRL
jgi:3-methyladenine DNA glycosylase/8-oxoguanine DNA glycosylase